MITIIGSNKSTIDVQGILKAMQEEKDELVQSLADILKKFKTVQLIECIINDQNVIVNLTVSDAYITYQLMDVFFNGSNPWNISHCGWESHPTENRIFLSISTSLEEFYDDEDLIGFGNLKREIDYKICLLKSALGG